MRNKKLIALGMSVCMALACCACGQKQDNKNNKVDGDSQTATGTAAGFGGEVSVTLTMKDGKLVDAVAKGEKETEGVGSRAISEMPAAMIEAGSIDVDGVTGASVSSAAVKAAAKMAWGELTGEQTTEEVKMKPGTYTGSAKGFRTAWNIDATVTVSETEILSVEIAEDSADTVGIFQSAVNLLVPRIVEKQSVSVDAISGATVSSNGIKGAVTEALKEALVAGGSDEGAISAFQKPTEKVEKTEKIETDVLVVGMGGSGMAAAMSAVENLYEKDPSNVNVLAIDKAGRYGGASALCSGVFTVNPDRFQEEHNEGKDYVDRDFLLKDWIEYTKGDAKQEMVELLLDESGDTMDWLVYEHGLEIIPPAGGLTEGDDLVVCYSYSPNDKGITVRRQNNIKFYDNMIADYTSKGGKYMLETAGYELIYDDATKEIKGVKAYSTADGTQYEIYAKSVVMATGGFAGSAEMEEKYLSDEYFPLKDSWSQVGMTQSKGEMMQAAIDIGANTYNIGMCPSVHITGSAGYLTNFEYHETEQYQSQTNKPLVWTEGDLPMYMGNSEAGMVVDTTGKRFTNEAMVGFNSWISGPSFYTIYSNEQVKAIAENGMKVQPGFMKQVNLGACGWAPEGTPIANAEEVMDAAVEAGYVFKADTIEELAQQLDMDPAVLAETVAKYNGYCETGVDEEFKKPADFLDKIGEGPYYAIHMRSYCYSTCGGLDVDTDFSVLNASDSAPINGLYAAGLDCSGVLFTEKAPYVTYGGVDQGWAFTSGRLAGASAAENVTK